jgi:chromosome segregation ATPase
MVEENDPSSNSGAKKAPQMKHYPFGTSTSFSYSKFSHLSGDVYEFATSLAGTASDIKPEIGQKETIVKTPTKKKSSSTASAKKDDENDFLKTLTASEDGVKPCDRKDCKEVIKKIIERQSKNKYERDDMEADTDKCLADIEYYETQNSNIEDRVKSLVRQENQLQQTVDHLAIELEKLEKTKNEIQSERDGYVNKVNKTYFFNFLNKYI